MTPKEKATSLYLKMSSHPHDNAKHCALVCVDEILKFNDSDFILFDIYDRYWKKVKQEIEKL